MNMNNYNCIKYALAVLLLLVGAMSSVSNTNASVVKQVTLSQEAQQSQLIFEGQVISEQVRYAPNGDPYTYFTFKVLDVIKGTYALPTIELGYMGGTTANGLVLRISDMRMPKVGEHGIYFVESLTRRQVHPLYGWQQGHYIVIPPQAGAPARVVPVNTPPGAMITAPSLMQFKQQVRALAGGGK